MGNLIFDEDTNTGVSNADELPVSVGEPAVVEGTNENIAPAGEDGIYIPDEVGGSVGQSEVAVTESILMDESVALEHTENALAESMEDLSRVGAEGGSDIEAIMDERYGKRSGHYNLRPRHERNFDRWMILSLPAMEMMLVQVRVWCIHNTMFIKD